MQQQLISLLTTGVATSVLSFGLVAPASAQVLENAGIGAAAGTATGIVIGEKGGIDDAINGAAVGAAVGALGGNNSSLVRDIAVGAIAGGLAGTLTNDDSFVENALQGAAAGAAVSTLGGEDGLARQVLGRRERRDRNVLSRGSIGRRVLGGVLRRTILDRALGGNRDIIFGF